MRIITVGLLSFLITFFLIPKFIPFLKRLKFRQVVRDEVQQHQVKTGTPVMGGIVFVAVPVIIYCFFGHEYGFFNNWHVLVMLISYVGYALIGFIDDYIVVIKKHNDGLRPLYKFLLQSVLAIVLIYVAHLNLESTVYIPFTDIKIDLGIIYPIFAFIMFTATSNGTNLADGLDGLCSGLSIIAFTGFAIISYKIGFYDVAMFLVAVIASLLAYLYYNKSPAKIFMGDVGSLALGGLLAGVGLVTHHEFMVAILGFVFVVEVVSVVLQVASFKLRKGKRIFKMAPLHHHFELSGMSEQSVVLMFWCVGLICLGFGLFWEFFF